MAGVVEGAEAASLERKDFSITVTAAGHLTEEDLVIADVVLVNHPAVRLGQGSLDDRQAIFRQLEVALPESVASANCEAAGDGLLFAAEN